MAQKFLIAYLVGDRVVVGSPADWAIYIGYSPGSGSGWRWTSLMGGSTAPIQAARLIILCSEYLGYRGDERVMEAGSSGRRPVWRRYGHTAYKTARNHFG